MRAQAKEKEFCEGNVSGKGIRCIIDFLRDEEEQGNTSTVKAVLSEKPQHAGGFAPFSLDLYPVQLLWLKKHGVALGEGDDKYDAISRAFRSMIDYCVRIDDDKAKIEEIFETVRCLNC